jgi:hypothetical protein
MHRGPEFKGGIFRRSTKWKYYIRFTFLQLFIPCNDDMHLTHRTSNYVHCLHNTIISVPPTCFRDYIAIVRERKKNMLKSNTITVVIYTLYVS